MTIGSRFFELRN